VEQGGKREYLLETPLLCREDPYEARCEKVTLSTLHAAKGLEFPVVFMAGLEEGIMPYVRGDEEDPRAALAEERRLMYVGMTRAKARLYLTRARQRFLYGQRLKGEPSPFLTDISGDLVRFVREKKRQGKKDRSKEKPSDGQLKLF
jgi:DNA helicase-2/ATP-dependent DNA helicase PcrA